MHFLCFAIVPQPTKEAVKEAMEPHKGTHWDWYRCGGRWDGFLLGEAEMKARETDNGFNYSESNNNAERNAIKVSELPPDKIPHSFIVAGDFIPREYYDAYAKPVDFKGYYGDLRKTPDYEERFRKALADNPDAYIVVIDVHN